MDKAVKLKSKEQVKAYLLERLNTIRRIEELGVKDRFLEGEKFALEYLYNLIAWGEA
ncbi:MAG: hypothetical protein QW175_05380 [Candidatus Bathyarchaeia archaeon]